jgi:hypothetical protein
MLLNAESHDGAVRSCGRNNHGQLGDKSTSNRPSFITSITDGKMKCEAVKPPEPRKAWEAGGNVPNQAKLQLELVAADATDSNWPSTGSQVATYSGNAAPTTADGVAAVNFRAKGDNARVNDFDIGPSAKPQLTVEMWVYMHSKAGDYGWAFGPDEGGGYDRSFVLHDPRFHGVSLCVGHAGWGSNVDMPLNKWVHLVGTWDQSGPNQAYLYMDKQRYGPESVNNGEQGKYFVIGNRFEDDGTYNSDIAVSAVRVWDGILTQDEVNELFDRGPSQIEAEQAEKYTEATANNGQGGGCAPQGTWHATTYVADIDACKAACDADSNCNKLEFRKHDGRCERSDTIDSKQKAGANANRQCWIKDQR